MHFFGIKVTGSSKGSKNKTPKKISPPPLFGNDPSPPKKLKWAALLQGVGHAMPSEWSIRHFVFFLLKDGSSFYNLAVPQAAL